MPFERHRLRGTGRGRSRSAQIRAPGRVGRPTSRTEERNDESGQSSLRAEHNDDHHAGSARRCSTRTPRRERQRQRAHPGQCRPRRRAPVGPAPCAGGGAPRPLPRIRGWRERGRGCAARGRRFPGGAFHASAATEPDTPHAHILPRRAVPARFLAPGRLVPAPAASPARERRGPARRCLRCLRCSPCPLRPRRTAGSSPRAGTWRPARRPRARSPWAESLGGRPARRARTWTSSGCR